MMITAGDGRKALKHPNGKACIASNTAVAFIAKNSGSIRNLTIE
jgi:hypothetical protein